MNSSNKRSIILILSLTGGLLGAVLRLMSVLFAYDKEISYYSSGAILPIISNAFFALAAIGFILLPFLILCKDESVCEPCRTVRYTAVLPALALVCQIYFAATPIPEAIKIMNMYASSEQAVAAALEVFTLTLALFATVISAVFFVSLAISRKTGNGTVLCGVGFILWIALAWMESYTDFLVPMNSPDKLFLHFGYVGAALLTVGELRAICGTAKEKSYYCYLSLSILTLSSATLPAIIGKLCGAYADNSVKMPELVLLGVLIYAVARAVFLLKEQDVVPTPDADEENTSDACAELTEQVHTDTADPQ